MHTPIQPHIGADRLAVRDLDRDAERYDRLLDLNVKPAERFDRKLHTFNLENGTDLVLEAGGADGADEAVTPLPSSLSFTVFAAETGSIGSRCENHIDAAISTSLRGE